MFDFGLVLGASSRFLCLFFDDFFIFSVALGLLVNGIAQLRLAVELDQQISLLHAASAGDEFGNGERAHLLAGQKRSLNRSRLNGRGHAFQAQSFRSGSAGWGGLRVERVVNRLDFAAGDQRREEGCQRHASGYSGEGGALAPRATGTGFGIRSRQSPAALIATVRAIHLGTLQQDTIPCKLAPVSFAFTQIYAPGPPASKCLRNATGSVTGTHVAALAVE